MFLLGAGFSRPAGLPLASELLDNALGVARSWMSTPDGYNHLNHAVDRYRQFLEDTGSESELDLEEFGAWLDWEHALDLRGSDTFSEHGNEASLQLRWAIGKTLHDAMPETLPQVYLDFAAGLTTTDHVLTLNYDLVLERALEEVELPYRRFPDRFSEVHEMYSTVDNDQPEELVLSKLHGSIDWVHYGSRTHGWADRLVEGLRQPDDPLGRIGVVSGRKLDEYYHSPENWWQRPPVLMPPSTAKPMAGSPLVPLWSGLGHCAYMRGGFSVIGCSLPKGDPYLLQLVHELATGYGSGLPREGIPWAQRRMSVVDLRATEQDRQDLLNRFRFFDGDHTDFVFGGFDEQSLPYALGRLVEVSP